MLQDEDVKALGEGHYERRTLAFFDVLGWKGRVDRAARNPHRLAELRLVTLGLGATRGIGFEEQGGRLTSFSDNVVISIPFARETLQEFLELVSRIQVGLAMWGFFIRGGITIGDVLHDASSLFGPALIRAYELESKHAKYPRLIFDPGIPELEEIEDYVMQDGGYRFIDPFYDGFIDTMRWRTDYASFAKFLSEHGGAPDTLPRDARMSSREILTCILYHLSEELRMLGKPEDRVKLEWLFDRIAPRLRLNDRGRNYHPD